MKQEQITKRKQKRREPTTEELQADFLERREQEAKIGTLKIAHGHIQTGAVLDDSYFVGNISKLEAELEALNKEEQPAHQTPEKRTNFAKYEVVAETKDFVAYRRKPNQKEQTNEYR